MRQEVYEYWHGGDPSRNRINLLGIPAELELITVMPYGYRITGTQRVGTPRKAISEMVHREKFGQLYGAS